jgi:glycosyltransferase involved in cell wall biosynthesis
VKTLIVCHYFPPEIGAPQTRLSELARMWVEAGDEVTVLTGLPNHPTGVVPPEYRRFRLQERIDGYRVLRAWVYATPNEGIVKKTLGHLSFMVTSMFAQWQNIRDVDVVVVSSPTFFSIFSAWILARLKNAKLVVEVRDLWPAIFVELGVITNPLVVRLLERIELAAYRAADAVVVVSDGFRDNIVERGIPAAKVHTIRNGVDLTRFNAPKGSSARLRSELGAGEGEVLVVYVGAHGISHGLRTVVEAAGSLSREGIHFAFVGEGAEKAELVKRVEAMGVRNITMLPGRPSDEIPEVLQAADICLVPLRKVPLFKTFIPSKMFEYFAAGRAVIGAVEGEAADILNEAGALVIEPENPDELASAVRKVAFDSELRKEMGVRARSYVETEFDRRTLAARYRRLLASSTERI